MWISKSKDERKSEFIYTALELFTEKGYENTSINDILKKMNITKGSFYYNFESKEDLLVQIVDLLTKGIVRVIQKISEQEELSALEKLRKLSYDMIHFRYEHKTIYQALIAIQYDEKNILIAKRFFNEIIRQTTTFIAKILEQGIKEKVFKIVNLQETSELYIRLLILYKEKIVEIIRKNDKNNLTTNENIQKQLEEIYSGLIGSLLGIDKKHIDYLTYYEEE